MNTIIISKVQFTSLALVVISFCVMSTGCAGLGAKDSKPLADRGDQSPTNKDVVSDFEQKRNEAQFKAAEARWQQGDNKACEELLTGLLVRNPDDKPSAQLLADLYASQDRHDEAIRLLSELLTKHPHDAQVHHSLGLLFESKGDASSAKQHFVQAAQLEPANELYSKFLKGRANPGDNVVEPVKPVTPEDSSINGVSTSISG